MRLRLCLPNRDRLFNRNWSRWIGGRSCISGRADSNSSPSLKGLRFPSVSRLPPTTANAMFPACARSSRAIGGSFQVGMNIEQITGFAWSKTWLEAACSFLYPEVCQVCNQEPATPGNGFVGDNCRKNVTKIVPPFCERCGSAFEGDITGPFECTNCRTESYAFIYARSAALFRSTLLDIIHKYKYNHALWFEAFLAELLTDAAAPVLLCEPCAPSRRPCRHPGEHRLPSPRQAHG